MAIKCCDITAGKLNRLITIERASTTPDSEGGFTDAWTADPAGGVWAMVKPMSGAERWFAERVTPGNRYRFVIRFKGDGNGAPYYTIADRVVYNGRTLGIEAVTDIEDEGRYLEVLAVENKAS